MIKLKDLIDGKCIKDLDNELGEIVKVIYDRDRTIIIYEIRSTRKIKKMTVMSINPEYVVKNVKHIENTYKELKTQNDFFKKRYENRGVYNNYVKNSKR